MEGVEGYVSSVLDQCNPKETIEAFVQVQAGLSIECDMSFPEPRREEVAPLVRTHLERLFVEALEAFQENDDD
ncbi:MAG: hypothetical protein J5855_08535 [Mailhella sp.]|nr:hypothetical protein [Mailhella sp.]